MIRNCLNCDLKFTYRDPQQKFCTEKCRRRYHYNERREYNRLYAQKYSKTVSKETIMLRNAKARAKRAGLDFNIDINDIIIPKYCPVLGYKLETTRGQLFSKRSPTLDRVDNAKGYIKGNVKVISSKANAVKNNLIIQQVERLLQYMRGEI